MKSSQTVYAMDALIYPVIALLCLILLVLLLTVTRRVRGAKRKAVPVKVFRTMQMTNVDEYYVTPGNNFNNLMQLPLLFILFVLFCIVTNEIDMFYVVASWLFVASRYIHSLIHITVNNVLWRVVSYAVGTVVLFICWFRLLFSLTN
ncbi:MAPEG family protein [Psychrobium sp. 1_MG-2023]|uniref:MAPEG family protein n=1 Tax=Psychrobium sp. 1_MG-2023 TaxID=3062624 RepID=UPI0027356566|nr:MAPEG family protein [Psychrobium sp. 1_MG-2023]MDP2559934.1 MAPEG family protein [Psychrobium sp. 1_MG-2023]